jgi:hypothetical protein
MDWSDLAQDRDQWRALVKKRTFGFCKMLGNSRVTERLMVSQKELSSVASVSLILGEKCRINLIVLFSPVYRQLQQHHSLDKNSLYGIQVTFVCNRCTSTK